METVSVSRTFDSPPDAVREVILADVPAFIRASGFDSVLIDGEEITVSREIGIATFELTLEERESNHLLAFDQTAGLFERMWTDYRLEATDTGSKLTATTEFTIGGVLAPVLDGTMIHKQRTREFELQFDYVAEQLASD